MDIEQFNDALQKGLGRAYLYVQQHGDYLVRNSILYHCLNNSAYDPQCDEDRAHWLMSLVKLTNNQDFYIPKIISALTQASQCWDASQLFSLCAIIAKDGSQQAKKAIYNKFDTQDFDDSGTDGIINLDAWIGLKYIAQRIGKRLDQETDFWNYGEALRYAGELFGETQAKDYLEKLATDDRNIRIYLDEIKKHESDRSSTTKESYVERIQQKYPLTRILSDVENKRGRFLGYYTQFGKHAKTEDIQIVFDKLIQENRNAQLLRYLYIFRRRELPRLDDKLLQLVYSDNENIQNAVLEVLGFCQDDLIHKLAITLSSKPHDSLQIGIIQLLVKNYQQGDYKIIEAILPKTKDHDDLHGVCMSLIDLFKNNKLEELLACCLWIYNKTPCAICRWTIVQHLVEANLIPQELIHECQYDCSDQIQTLVKNYPEKIIA